MRIPSYAALITVLCSAAAPLAAQSATRTAPTRVPPPAKAPATRPAPAASGGSATSIGVRVSTLGVGLELSRLLGNHLGLRVGGNYLNLTRTDGQSQIAYDAKVKLQSFSGIIDWYPGRRGAFHLSAGAVTNPLTIDAVGLPSDAGNYEINGTEYTAAQVGTFTGSAKFGSVLPYAGLGFGTPASKSKGVGVVFDIGAAIGKPTVLLNASNAASNAALAADMVAENATRQKDANALAVWPVVSLGLTFRF